MKLKGRCRRSTGHSGPPSKAASPFRSVGSSPLVDPLPRGIVKMALKLIEENPSLGFAGRRKGPERGRGLY